MKFHLDGSSQTGIIFLDVKQRLLRILNIFSTITQYLKTLLKNILEYLWISS